MIPLPQYKGTSVGVLGLGPQGQAAVRALEDSGAKVIAWDQSEATRIEAGGTLIPPRDWPLSHMKAVILADGDRRGLGEDLVDRAWEAGADILTDFDLFVGVLNAQPEERRPTVVTVTGAAGKSVTVSMIAHLLKEQGRTVAVGGQVGRAFLDLPAPSADLVYLLEIPVRRLATAQKFRSDISVVLNIAGQPSAAAVELAISSLRKVFKGQGPQDTAIVGVDDVLGQKVCTLLRSAQPTAHSIGTIIPVSGEASLGHGIFALDGTAYSAHRGKAKAIGDFSRAAAFPGPHLNQDAAAAIAVCLTLGVSPEMIIKSLHSYQGLSGRFECLGVRGRVMFVDDSYASTLAATQRAIGSCPDVFWIGHHPELAEDCAGAGAGMSAVHGRCVLDPLSGDKTLARLEAAVAKTVTDAEELIARDPNAAPVILYSPGIPLKGQRGTTAFRHIVGRYIEGQSRYA